MLVLAETKCNILFIPPTSRNKYRPASCVQVYISTCNVSSNGDLYDPIVEAGYVAYLSPFIMFKATYRNVFCFLCNRPQWWHPSLWPGETWASDYPFSGFIYSTIRLQTSAATIMKHCKRYTGCQLLKRVCVWPLPGMCLFLSTLFHRMWDTS